MADTTIVPHSLDDYFQSTPLGSIDKAIGNNLYGINHRQTSTVVPSNKDMYGLTFFVKPQLNMQLDNIRNVRQFSALTTDNVRSIQQFAKCTLDPRLMAGYQFMNTSIPPIACPMVDPLNAFIPILTNNLNSISGWPDVIAPTHASKAGLYNEVHAMVDGITRNYETFDIDASFRNTRGDPILYLFYIWLHYSSFVFEGKLVPYLDFITENEIDYNTRIYRLVLDKDRNKVTKIAATGAAFPISLPTGSFFDYNSERPFNDQNKDITIRFKCMGVDYQDDITIKEFNQTVVIFNPAMADNNRARYMLRVDSALLPMFNNRGYPRINPDNYVLEWWVPIQMYNSRTSAFLSSGLSVGATVSKQTNVEQAQASASSVGSNEEDSGD
jgi:hypothetical protein